MAKLAEQVEIALKGMTEVDGKQTFPEGTSEDVIYAANAVRRQRDTQSSFTKSQERVKALESENNQIVDRWSTDVAKNLTSEQQSELEELKNTDPEEWRVKLNEYESSNASKVKDTHTEIKKKAQQETEMEKRTRLLQEHNEANPDYQLTDDVIDNDLPAGYTKQLEAGTITFEEFLDKSNTYLGAPKKIKQSEEAPNETDLSALGGKDKPSEDAIKGEVKESYKKETY